MQNTLELAKNWLLDLLFPRECLICKSSKSYLCRSCAYKIPLLKMQACPVCGIANYFGQICSIKCRQQSYLDQLLVAADYHKSQVVHEAISLLKYRFAQDIAFNLSIALHFTFVNFFNFSSPILTAVPLHPARLKYRGFNQAELLACALANHSNKLYIPLLQRIKNTKMQAELGKAQRHKNTKYAFKAELLFIVDHVVIIDDVYTTGSTMNDCARALKQVGVKHVTGLVLARSFVGKRT